MTSQQIGLVVLNLLTLMAQHGLGSYVSWKLNEIHHNNFTQWWTYISVNTRNHLQFNPFSTQCRLHRLYNLPSSFVNTLHHFLQLHAAEIQPQIINQIDLWCLQSSPNWLNHFTGRGQPVNFVQSLQTNICVKVTQEGTNSQRNYTQNLKNIWVNATNILRIPKTVVHFSC